jgi:membrane-associated protein
MEFLDPKFIVETLGLFGTASIIFAESGLFFGFFLPGDSLLFTAGLLSSQGFITLHWLLVLCFLASVIGDNVGYWFGKRVGPSLFSKEDSFLWNKKHVVRSKIFFDKHGKKAIILARFMPIIRTFTPILAGVGTMHYKTFFKYNIIGGFIWTFGMILLGFGFGNLIPNPDKYLLPVILAIVGISFVPGIIEFIRNNKKQ